MKEEEKRKREDKTEAVPVLGQVHIVFEFVFAYVFVFVFVFVFNTDILEIFQNSFQINTKLRGTLR